LLGTEPAKTNKPSKEYKGTNMKAKRLIVVGLIATTVAAMTASAASTNVTFRSPASFEGVFQGEVGGKPAYEFEHLIGADLVNLALGTALGTLRTNEVLALEVACDSSSAELVVFDKATKSNLVTIATSSSPKIIVVQQQDNPASAFPDRERFATEMDIVPSAGSNANALVSGFVDVAGRLYLNPTNGCPRAVLVDTDRKQDAICGDPKGVTVSTDVSSGHKKLKGKDEDETEVAGRGHFHGALSAVFAGQTNTVVVPDGALSIDRQLAP
jgi:hypothetical protein